MRAFEARLNRFAVVRNEAGQLLISGDVSGFARAREPADGLDPEQQQNEGARALIEDVVGARTLEQHDVALEQVQR